MAYIKQNRARIEVRKQGSIANLLGGVTNALGQAAISEVANMVEERDLTEQNDAFSASTGNLGAKWVDIQNQRDPGEWVSQYEAAKNNEIERINGLDMSGHNKRQAIKKFEALYNKNSGVVKAAVIQEVTEIENKNTLDDLTGIKDAEDASSTVRMQGAEFVEAPEGVDPDYYASVMRSRVEGVKFTRPTEKSFIEENTEAGFSIDSEEDDSEPAFDSIYVKNGASSYDKKKAAAKWRLERRYPNAPEKVGRKLDAFEDDLRTTQPELDLKLNLAAELNGKPFRQWDFDTFKENAIETLKESEYGGRTLSYKERKTVIREVEAEFENLKADRTAEVARIYEAPGGVAEQINGRRAAYRTNPMLEKNQFTTEDIKQIWEESYGNDDYKFLLSEQYWNTRDLGTAVDRAVKGRKLQELLGKQGSGQELSQEELSEMSDYRSIFTIPERASLQQAITNSMNTLNMWSADVEMGQTRVITPDLYTTVAALLPTFETEEDFDKAIERKGWNLPDHTYKEFRSEIRQRQATTTAANAYRKNEALEDMSGRILNNELAGLSKDDFLADHPNLSDSDKLYFEDVLSSEKKQDATAKLFTAEENGDLDNDKLASIAEEYGLSDDAEFLRPWRNEVKVEAVDEFQNDLFSSLRSELSLRKE